MYLGTPLTVTRRKTKKTKTVTAPRTKTKATIPVAPASARVTRITFKKTTAPITVKPPAAPLPVIVPPGVTFEKLAPVQKRSMIVDAFRQAQAGIDNAPAISKSVQYAQAKGTPRPVARYHSDRADLFKRTATRQTQAQISRQVITANRTATPGKKSTVSIGRITKLVASQTGTAAAVSSLPAAAQPVPITSSAQATSLTVAPVQGVNTPAADQPTNFIEAAAQTENPWIKYGLIAAGAYLLITSFNQVKGRK